MMARLASTVDPLRIVGMQWYRPAIRPRLQAANDVAPLSAAAPGQGAQLQSVLESNYASLHRRLTRHLGCAELASDSLHDAWLRLGAWTAWGGAALAHSPVAYVFRVACNAAMDSLRRKRAWLYADEGDGDGAGLVDFLADTAAGPERLAELKADVRRLAQAVDLLPRRHQQVLEALRVDELTRQEVAERHDMSLRNVDTALRQALDHCARHTGHAAMGGAGTTRRSLRLKVRSRTDA
ncbi:hypothetical protein CNX70_14145 [Janthinobacterium svalbardensis]|uniref:RNA polymerase subunit sigma-70 n=1 Tax=Janthinobacterium svalbardensis TaxID=368607 RepID=A0A290WWA8_9BURK|nr:sigma-70 family RNA polymerase sigma factor [Janthinobacterium svalbardensis]ATD61170.1 hypothetical protein CNX70_14145 [Janthinobacterium svalbardensis]